MPQPIPPNMQINATLEAKQWNDVLMLLQEVAAPYRVTAPIIQTLTVQLLNQQQTQPQQPHLREVTPEAS